MSHWVAYWNIIYISVWTSICSFEAVTVTNAYDCRKTCCSLSCRSTFPWRWSWPSWSACKTAKTKKSSSVSLKTTTFTVYMSRGMRMSGTTTKHFKQVFRFVFFCKEKLCYVKSVLPQWPLPLHNIKNITLLELLSSIKLDILYYVS